MIRNAAKWPTILLSLAPMMASAQSQPSGAFFYVCNIAQVERDPSGSGHVRQVGPYHQLNTLISEEIIPDDQHLLESKGPLRKVLTTYDPDKLLGAKGFQYFWSDASGGGALIIGDMRLADNRCLDDEYQRGEGKRDA